MRRSVRYAIAVAASSGGGALTLAAGLLVGNFAARHGLPTGEGAVIILSVLAAIAIPAIIVKKLLVDYW